MLGVMLRELEGATPGLQDVPAVEVQAVRSITLSGVVARIKMQLLLYSK